MRREIVTESALSPGDMRSGGVGRAVMMAALEKIRERRRAGTFSQEDARTALTLEVELGTPVSESVLLEGPRR